MIKRFAFVSTLASAVVGLGCGEDAQPPYTPPVAGAAGSSPGGASFGGTPSTEGGSAPVAGSSPGGSAPMAGASTGGSGGSGGAMPMAGSGGSAPMAGVGGSEKGGSGGMGGMGTGGKAAGGSSGAPMGGAPMGGAPMGGTGGSGSITVAQLVGALDGHLVYSKCADTPQSDDCVPATVYKGETKTCSGSKMEHIAEYPIAGEMGKTYNVTMHFYGIMEPKVYGTSVMREAGNMAANRNGMTPYGWGHQPTPGQPLQASDYNNYELHVLNPSNQVVGTYVFNSDTGTGHWTLLINYSKTIPLIGGGKVRTRVYDQNCRQIKNCGANGSQGGTQCAQNARSIPDVSKADPPPPATFQQPGLGNQPAHSGQWFYIDVTAVAPAM